MDRLNEIKNSPAELQQFFSLLNQLKEFYDERFSSLLNRSHPFADLLFDRWERARSLGFGAGTSIYDSSHVFGNVTVGENTWIGPFTVLAGSGNLSIGKNCSISAGVQIYSHDSVEWAISGGKEQYTYSQTSIGNNCFIGPNSIISKGVVLGDETVVGANSFVNRSYPKGSRIAGSPAKVIKSQQSV